MNEENVVKCNNEECGMHYGYSQEQTACPFCNTSYKVSEEKVAEKPKVKKLVVKTEKESFKMWNDDSEESSDKK